MKLNATSTDCHFAPNASQEISGHQNWSEPGTCDEGSPMLHYLEQLHARLCKDMNGALADYIPELAKADPASFGIALATVDGRIYQVGDSRTMFSIQSISKAITYGLALEDNGLDSVLEKIGVEPSGDVFNAISVEQESGRPLNPMINAGAIATTGLIHGRDDEDKFARVRSCFERYTGRSMDVDAAVYQSESATGHRNRAISYLLHGNGIIGKEPEKVVERYFRQCALRVSARDLAVMAGSLANDGVNPVTNVRALSSRYVSKVLSVMSTCGMYDYSGNWMFRVGMPAKSGVGGGIMAVMPGQFGIGIFSPLLDERGNSVRGIKLCEHIADELGLHSFNVLRTTSTGVIKSSNAQPLGSASELATTQLESLPSPRKRREVALKGVLNLGNVLAFVDDIESAFQDTDEFMVDLSDVTDISAAATRLLAELWTSALRRGKRLVMRGIDDKYVFFRTLKRHLRSKDIQMAGQTV